MDPGRLTDVIIGTAPDSWGVWFAQDPRQTPWQRFLDEAATAGYAWTELGPYGYLPTDAGALAPQLHARGLRVTGSAVVADLADAAARPAIEREAERVCALLAAVGGRFLVLIDDTYSDLATGRLKHAKELDAAGWSRLLETTGRLGRIAQSAGLTAVFHPHAQTRVETEAQIEALLARTDPALVGLCLDTGHHAYLGQDPVAFFRKHHRRIPYLHVKSVDPVLRERVRADDVPFGEAVTRGVFCEPARGVVDFPALRAALEEIRWRGFAIVEQDMFPTAFDRPLPIATRTLAYLHGIGFGDAGRGKAGSACTA
jgi:inosose dehydratase